jgi:hypothetical protein
VGDWRGAFHQLTDAFAGQSLGSDLLRSHRSRADRGLAAHCWQLAWALRYHLDLGPWHDQAAIWELVLDAARRIPDAAAQARLSRLLADAYSHLDRTEDACAP